MKTKCQYTSHGCCPGDPTRVLTGDAREQLRSLPAASVHCCATSPPYYGLRDYGTAGTDWPAVEYRTLGGVVTVPAWHGCLGLEPTPEMYVGHMVLIFREVGRVLRPDGTLWLNLGDSYVASACGVKQGGVSKSSTLHGARLSETYRATLAAGHAQTADKTKIPGVKKKDLLGIPWAVAFALRADGWTLRQDMIWHKPNPMPASISDRCTTAHEYLFLLSRSPRYYYDAVAVAEPASGKSGGARFGKKNHKANSDRVCQREYDRPEYATRNRRSVWTITTRPYKGAHFATFPPALVEPCVKAGTSERGVCPHCGAPWARVTSKVPAVGRRSGNKERKIATDGERSRLNTHMGESIPYEPTTARTTGWKASCTCPEHSPVPAVVLDPFAGSGTTLAVAAGLGRFAVGVELNPEYVPLIGERVGKAVPPLAKAG